MPTRRRPRGSARGDAPTGRPTRAFVYVEGARDRDILRIWARRFSPALGRALVDATVILGGRQPARAVAHMRRQRAGAEQEVSGVCVLDHDGHGDVRRATLAEAGPALELFTWGRRHIESYLLVPEAIRRGLQVDDHDGHFVRWLARELPALGDERRMGEVDAKRWLSPKGPLAQALGRPVAPSRIARAMRVEEFHRDVRALLERLRDLMLEEDVSPQVHVRVADGRG